MDEYTGQDTRAHADAPQKHNDHHKMDQNMTVACTQGLHDGDGILLFTQQGRQCTLDTDPGYDQNKNTHQIQEKNKPFEKALDPLTGRFKGIHLLPFWIGNLS